MYICVLTEIDQQRYMADLLVDLLKTTTGEVPLLAEHFDEKKYCPSTVVGRLSNLKPTDDHFRRSQRLIIS